MGKERERERERERESELKHTIREKRDNKGKRAN